MLQLAETCTVSVSCCSVAPPGHPWNQRRLGSWQQSGPGLPSCPSGWTCVTGARSSRQAGGSSSEYRSPRRHPACGVVWAVEPSGPFLTSLLPGDTSLVLPLVRHHKA